METTADNMYAVHLDDGRRSAVAHIMAQTMEEAASIAAEMYEVPDEYIRKVSTLYSARYLAEHPEVLS